ncbi:gamma-soluble NSF attachment protein-like [Gracilinanus agilis]|uniref:gamma-soluble NSF attachment protein-like n=1 Tax=Gracilinanus agilis TaxID=191870 RepID=UPI001CFD1EF5|nr:gamma-soluble NSF attachment protein-like [Gracilinanus agilis]
MDVPKNQEGLVHLARAENYLKTRLLRMKPDYDGAAFEYGKAALAFKKVKHLRSAKEAFLKEAEAHQKNDAPFYAAKAYEQAGLLLKEMRNLPEAAQVIEKAITLYLESDSPNTAAMTLRQFSLLLESQIPEQLVSLYQQAAKVFETENRPLHAVDLIGRASKVLVRTKRFAEAAISLDREKNLYKEMESFSTCFKRIIAEILVYLHSNEFVAAYKCVQESCDVPGFKGSEEHIALVQLLECYDRQDQEQMNKICSNRIFKNLGNDYTKLSSRLKIPAMET